MPIKKGGTSQVEVEGCSNQEGVTHQKVSLTVKRKFHCFLHLVSPKLTKPVMLILLCSGCEVSLIKKTFFSIRMFRHYNSIWANHVVTC